VWYLVADTEAGLRTFRIWRVQSVDLTDDPVRRPPGFDLARTWQEIVARLDEQRGSMRVAALADPSVVGPMRGHFGNRLTVGDTRDDGRVSVDIGFGARYGATHGVTHGPAAELAGYCFGLEVLDPPEVQVELAAIGARLIERYGAA